MDRDFLKKMLAILDGRVQGAAQHLVNEVKKTLSVPAPRVRLVNQHGTMYYVAGWKVSDQARPGALSLSSGRTLVKNRVTKQLEERRVHYEKSPATPGAPPRKLSGRLRTSITMQKMGQAWWRVGTNVVYGRRHEYGTHPYLSVTLLRERAVLNRILSGA